MRYYPYDIQICMVYLVIDGNAAKFLELHPGELVYSGGSSLAQYFVISYGIHSSKIKGRGGVKVSLKLGRRLLGVILTALTCILVLATMFISISNDLPKRAYLKIMDYWLVFNLLLSYMEMLTEEEDKTNSDPVLPFIEDEEMKM